MNTEIRVCGRGQRAGEEEKQIRVGSTVSLQHKGMKRRGKVTKLATKRSPRKKGKFWWVRLDGKEKRHVCYHTRDLSLTEN